MDIGELLAFGVKNGGAAKPAWRAELALSERVR